MLRRVKWFGFALALLVILSACGGGPNGNDSPESTFDPNEPAEIVFYSTNNDPVESFDSSYGEALRKKFPHYTIRYIWSGEAGNKLPELIVSGTRFDVFMQAAGHFETQAFPVSIEYDMADLIKKHNVDLNKLDPSAVDYVRKSSGDGIYFLPIHLNAMVLYYNRTLFDKFGEDYPQDNMTWGEMIEKAKVLTRIDGDVQYYGFSTNSSTIQGMNPLSIPLADIETDQPTINQDERWHVFFDYFYDQPRKLIPGYLEAIQKANRIPTLQNFVNDQTVGMFAYQAGFDHVWSEQLQSIDWNIVSLPTFAETSETGSMATPRLFGITHMAANKDAAMVAIQYLLSDEYQAGLARKGIIPVVTNDEVRKELGKDSVYSDRNWGAVFARPFAPLALRPAYYSQLNSLYIRHFTQATLGQVDLNTALRNAEEEAIRAIAEFKNQ